MNLLDKTFDNLKKENKKAFSVFLMAGYPDYTTSLELMHLCSNNGVDFIELGMAFSDPSADGAIIKMAGDIALNRGAKIKKTLDLIKEYRKTNKTTPIVWMGYFNSIFNYGIENFLQELNSNGVNGLLVVDLPFEEQKRLKSIEQYDISLIPLISPVTDNERTKEIVLNAKGFVYFVSIKGITGTKEAQSKEIENRIQFIKSNTNVPVIAGFGINDAKKAAQINKFADGTITGSALVKLISDNIHDKKEMFLKIEEFLQTFKK